MENKILYAYKTMPQFHKENLEKYLIYDGIYTVSPDISDKDAEFIFSICEKIKNVIINPFSISHYLTDHYLKGNIFEEELKKASSGDIVSAVINNDLNYLPLLNDRNEIERT